MTILDYIIIAAAAAGLVIGLLKGLLKQIFGILGVVVVSVGSGFVAPYAQQLLEGLIPDDANSRMAIAMIVSAVVIALVYGLITSLITRFLTKSKTLGALNRILGGVIGLGTVYLILAVAIELLSGVAMVSTLFSESWIVQNVYANNFFGKWILTDIAQGIMDSLTTAPEASLCILSVFC